MNSEVLPTAPEKMHRFDLSVMIIDDDDDIRYAVARILRKCGCEVTEIESVEKALEAMQAQRFDVAFCDLRFQVGANGEHCLQQVTERFPHVSMVMMSCSMTSAQKNELKALGAAECLQKPIFRDGFVRVLEQLKPQSDDFAKAA